MPIAPNFLGGGASSGITLPPATNIITQAASGRAYIRWKDPNDVTIQSGTLATWAGTLLVRQQGSRPETRHSGTVVLDSKTRDQYQDDWFCDSGLTNGVTYFYRLIPYSTDGFYTYDDSCCFSVTPRVIDPGATSELAVVSAGDGKLNITWDDPNQQYPLGNRPVQSLTVNIEPNQSGSGEPSQTNIRQISGWTYADVTQSAYGNDYIRDGLIFHLDGINRGGTAGKWIDLIGGKEFTLTGVTENANNVEFAGTSSSYGVYNGCVSGDFSAETIEICVEKNGTLRAFVLSQPKNLETNKYGISAIYAHNDGYGMYYVANGTKYAAKRITGVAYNDYKTVSLTYGGASCINLQQASNGSTGAWGALTSGSTYIGIKNPAASSSYPLNGKIYSIRIYNRKLSLAEMQHNQLVDNNRFNIGLNADGVDLSADEQVAFHEDFVNDTGNEVTVYGGTLDMVSGGLSVTHLCYTLTGEESWTSMGSGTKRYYSYQVGAKGYLLSPGNNFVNLCSHYTQQTISTSTTAIGFNIVNSDAQKCSIAIRPDLSTIGTVDAWKSYLAGQYTAGTPVQCVVKLATPVTYQLTPNSITTLIGENRYSANCGSVEAVYNTEDILSEWDHSNVIVKDSGWATGPTDTGAFTYSSTQLDAHRTTPLVATGLTNGTTYYVTVFPVSTDGAVNTDSVNKQAGVPGLIPIATVPTQSGTLTYNGSNQLPEWSNYDETQMTISCTAQTNAGTYEASVTPNADYCWSDGTTGARTIQWTIGKAALPKPTLSETSINLNASTTEDTFVVTRDGDGAVSAVSSNTNIVTVTATGNTTSGGKIFRVSSVNNTSGTATVTIHVAEGTNYLAYTVDDVTCNVSAQFKPVAYTTAQSGVTYTDGLSGLSAEDLNNIAYAISDNNSINNRTSEVFVSGYDRHISIGDIADSMDSGGYKYCLVGFNHYNTSSGDVYGSTTATGMAGMLFQFVNVTTWKQMYLTGSEADNWKNSSIRDYLANDMLTTFTQSARDVIKEVTVISRTRASSSITTSTEDKLFIAAAVEMYSSPLTGTREGSLYAWYTTNTGDRSHIKAMINQTSGMSWWTRTVHQTSSNSPSTFVYISTGGSQNSQSSQGFSYVVPCFCI